MLPREKGSSPLHNPFDYRCTARREGEEFLAGEVCRVCHRERALELAGYLVREVGS